MNSPRILDAVFVEQCAVCGDVPAMARDIGRERRPVLCDDCAARTPNKPVHSPCVVCGAPEGIERALDRDAKRRACLCGACWGKHATGEVASAFFGQLIRSLLRG